MMRFWMLTTEPSSDALAIWDEVNFNDLLVQYINYFFSIVTGMSLTQFAKSQFSTDVLEGRRPDFRNLVLYIAVMFFVVSDWFFYHYLITKYPYTHPLGVYRFIIDILLFCLMYFLLYTATQPISVHRLFLTLATLLAWHLTTQGWHIIRRFEYPADLLFTHLYRATGYATVLLIGLKYHKMVSREAVDNEGRLEKNFICAIIYTIAFLILYFNGSRLWYFLTHGPNPAPTLRTIDLIVVACMTMAGLHFVRRLGQASSPPGSHHPSGSRLLQQ